MNQPSTQVKVALSPQTIFAKAGSIRGDWYLIDADGKTLYIAARTGLYRIKLSVAGVRP